MGFSIQGGRMTVEQWLRVLVTDVRAVRVTCHDCSGVVELPVAQLVNATAQGACRFCGAELLSVDKVERIHNPLAKLSAALRDCAAMQKSMGVEFILPPPAKGA